VIEGYLPDTPYLATFIRELAPAWLDRVALAQGLTPPRRHLEQAFRYCELGCGRGVTTNILAATCPNGEFLGIDALDSHIDAARELSQAAHSGNIEFQAVRFEAALEESFAPFDYIVAHGVYSWVDRANREHLLNFVERHLKPGGLFYLSYNALPGWNNWLPAQKLLLAVAAKSEGDPEERFNRAADLIDAMHQADARFLNGNPALDQFKDRMERFPAGYLVHEYLIPTWEPFYSNDVMTTLAERGLSFVGTADQAGQRQDFLLRKSQRELLAAETDPALRELMRDIFLDTTFRRDLFARSPAGLDGQAVFQARAGQCYALNPAADAGDFSLSTPAGTLRFGNLAARELVQRLGEGPGTPADMAVHCRDATLADFVNTADALWAADIIRPVDPPARCRSLDKLNGALQSLAAEGEIAGLTAIPHGTALPCKKQACTSG